jgi:hypothetical protein
MVCVVVHLVNHLSKKPFRPVYPLRNGSDIIIPFCRLSITCDSFILSTIRQWNSLNPSLRNVESIATKKKGYESSRLAPQRQNRSKTIFTWSKS